MRLQKKILVVVNHFVVSSLKVDGQDARIVCTQETEICTVNIVLPKPFKSAKYMMVVIVTLKFLSN